MTKVLPITLILIVSLGFCFKRSFSQPGFSGRQGAANIAVRVRLGMTDRQETRWDGELSMEGGEIVSLRSWRPRDEDEITGKNRWVFSTTLGRHFRLRVWEPPAVTPPAPYIVPVGLVVTIKAAPSTTLRFKTAQGEFQVRPGGLRAGAPERFLNGAAVVDLVPVAECLSVSEAQNDFPALLGGPSGELFFAWVLWRESGDQVMLRRFDGNSWGPNQNLTEAGKDIFLVKLGRDRKGRPWAVWSEQVNGNFDLYGRNFDGRKWLAAERLTDDPQPDIYHNLATDSNGNLWLVWQGFRNGKSDIFVRRYDGTVWLPLERVSTSPANDWEPAIAADRQGRVYVAWDTYENGNYDVLMRRWENGEWSKPAAIAATPKYEAHVSLACDRENRLWAAWNESGFEWGKDSGFLPKRQGAGLYQSRAIAVAVYNGGEWQQPAAGLDESLPEELRTYNDLPVLHTDPEGRVWLFFRHRTLRYPDTPISAAAHGATWEIFGTWFEGERWAVPVFFPQSRGRPDMRGGFAVAGENLYAAWPTDNRDFSSQLFERADVYLGRVPLAARVDNATKLRARPIPELRAYPLHPTEAEDVRRIRDYPIETGGKTYHIYRGDMHRHTEFSNSDGNNDGSLQQAYRYALDAAGLDYLAVTDHGGNSGPDLPYINWLLQQTADVFHVPGAFTPLFAYERGVAYPNGHRNVILPRRGIPTLPVGEDERQAKVGSAGLYQYLRRFGGISMPHTSAMNQGTDWRDNDPAVEPLVEIYQGDRNSSEYEGAPKAAHRGDPASAAGGFNPAGYVWNAWAKGYKLGVQASSDHMSAHISYACTIAENSTRAGLLDAMRKRHCYGATDNIILDYRMSAGASEYLQGDIAEIRGPFTISVNVAGTAAIRQIDIIRSKEFVYTVAPLNQAVHLQFQDNQPLPGESYYYVRVIQVNDQMAWSSPIWVKR